MWCRRRRHFQPRVNPMFQNDLQTPSRLAIEEVTNPEELARSLRQHERHCQNSDWLESHWSNLMPQARGKFVAVAGQEGFIADTSAEAWIWTQATHPDDDGA